MPKVKKTKTEIIRIIWKNFYVLLGSFILALGNAVFCTKLNIVPGGLTGIGIIVQSFFPEGTQVIDIVTAILSVVLWIVGFFVIGKTFAIKTLAASISYPLFLTMCLRLPYFVHFAETVAADGSTGNVMLCAVFGGILIGAGVAVTFVGGGSSGGVDVIIFILQKYLHIKESIGSFLVDGTIILASFILMKDNIIPSMCGVLCVVLSALMIELVYIKSQSAYQVDIISEKYEEIKAYAMDVLMRGATIIRAEGGYKGEPRVILRLVIPKQQYDALRNFIAHVDDRALFTVTPTETVFGEGFKANHAKMKRKKVGTDNIEK